MLLLLSISIITFIVLYNNEKLEYDPIFSFIQDYNKYLCILFLIICSTILLPITIGYLIKINLKNKKMNSIINKQTKRLLIIILLLLGVGYITSISYNKGVELYNTNQLLVNSFNKEIQNRNAIYENIAYSISANMDIVLKVDSSFLEIVRIQTFNQKDGQNLTWKWLANVNPTASFSEIKEMYSEFNNSIQQYRNNLLKQESILLEIKQKQENLLSLFPNNIYFSFFDKKQINYIPISSFNINNIISTNTETIPNNILKKK